MLVEATRTVYYGDKRIREGQRFNLKSEKDFSDKSMIKVQGAKKTETVETGEVKKKMPKFVDVAEPKEDVI